MEASGDYHMDSMMKTKQPRISKSEHRTSKAEGIGWRQLRRWTFFIGYSLFLFLCGSIQAASAINAFAPGITTAYSVIRQADGDVWYVTGQVFEAWGTGGRTAADYDIALTEKGGDMFVGNFDVNAAEGVYHVVTHYQVGGSPSDSDPAVWEERGYWDGSVWGSDLVASLPTKEEIRAEIDANSTQLALIIEDTNELQTDWHNGGRLDLLIDAIKAATDILTMITTTVSDANDANSFTLTAGQDANDAYWGNAISIQDANDSHWESRMIISWTSARVVLVDEQFSFTPEVGDAAVIWTFYFTPFVYENLPKRISPDPTIIDRTAGSSMGATKTLDVFSIDP